ncbi:MAG TPA: 23S rRNA (adenine(2503)-C(2))-methyltransferase RlmN [Saprospiraceae bacterium]|nr:23S rRNA (adenine(2503)-C(2))-methyltransferase RlmN [Saprospiraceae bacterium]
MEEIKKDIRNVTHEELQAFCKEQGWEDYRIRQLQTWIWQKGVISFDEMTNLSLTMREVLKAHWTFLPLKEDAVQTSSDSTIKYRWLCHDGCKIESVLIPVMDEQRFTLCVSSQVGCSLSCKFCATGQMKRIRNLECSEIWDQVIMVDGHCRNEYGHHVTNIVYMGMGEPLLNYRNVLCSIEHITSPEGYGMSPRRITVSTAGIEKGIRRLADDGVKFNLALSLHAADDAKRSAIMPINDQNNLASLMSAILYFHQKTGGRISYEYILFKGFNDTIQDAKLLAGLCRQFPVRVNIIEYNPVEGVNFSRADDAAIDRFGRTLRDLGVMATVRRSRGKDIDAACGQLANK